MKTTKKLRIEIEIENAAFGNEGNEIARILVRLAHKLNDHQTLPTARENIHDVNGNTCGSVEVSNE